MTKMHWLVVSAALAIGMAAPASAAITDPEVIIYRFPGVRDSNAAENVGVATVFHCTNFSSVAENIRLSRGIAPATFSPTGYSTSRTLRRLRHPLIRLFFTLTP
jgi:hypothetical protein